MRLARSPVAPKRTKTVGPGSACCVVVTMKPRYAKGRTCRGPGDNPRHVTPGSGRDEASRPDPVFGLFGAEGEDGTRAGRPAGRAERAGDRDDEPGEGEHEELPRLVH